MVAEKIDGTLVAKRIRESINQEIKKKQETSSRFKPSLTIVQGE
jgi:methylenetetrahydrofolate dehydrogenase (NADP+)/methenyltetrahydrofolate cyclohydrolase/formyltetrahydrofolate synthetase